MAQQLTKAHIEAKRRLMVATENAVEQIWKDLPGYDRENLEMWLDRVTPVVDAAQRQAVSLADAYVATLRKRAPLGINPEGVTGAEVRNGTSPRAVYERPFVQVWTGLKNGSSYEDAVDAALARAKSSAATDVQLATTHAFQAIGNEDDGIFGWQRVPDGNACELCLIASTQRYHSGDLAPIHNLCNCSVEPLTEETGQIINRDRYEELKGSGAIDKISRQRQAGGYEKRAAANRDRAKEQRDLAAMAQSASKAAKYEGRANQWDARAADQEMRAEGIQAANRAPKDAEAGVAYHGELGPVLVNPAHHFDLPN